MRRIVAFAADGDAGTIYECHWVVSCKAWGRRAAQRRERAGVETATDSDNDQATKNDSQNDRHNDATNHLMELFRHRDCSDDSARRSSALAAIPRADFKLANTRAFYRPVEDTHRSARSCAVIQPRARLCGEAAHREGGVSSAVTT
jgi:hypothetical protein